MLSLSRPFFFSYFTVFKKESEANLLRTGSEVLPIWTGLALRLCCTELYAAVVLLVLSEFSGLGWIIQCSQQHLSLCTDLVYIRSLQVGQRLETRSPLALAINPGQDKKLLYVQDLPLTALEIKVRIYYKAELNVSHSSSPNKHFFGPLLSELI